MRKPRCIILSPHLDDAVLSCGGLIAALEGHVPVEIWTIFTRGSARGPYSPAALWLHGATSSTNPTQLYFQRREEDRAACQILGATWRHFNWVDAPYRKDSKGNFLYPADLCSDIHPADESLLEDIRRAIAANLKKGDIVLAPVAGRSHVDHAIVSRAAQMAAPDALFYPDLPYAIENQGSADGHELKRLKYTITEPQQAAWISAVGSFATQFFLLESSVGSVEEMISACVEKGLSLFAQAETSTECASAVLAPLGLAPARALTPVTPQKAVADWLPKSRLSDLSVAPGRAPIAVFAFRRLDHLQQTLASLEACETFSGREVVVFSDAARPRRPDEALGVARVRAWLRGWCRVRGAVLIEAKKNLGLKTSIVSSVTKILDLHDRIIVLEDDLILSKQFLVFMNESLEKFKDRDDVMQVSGYMVPHEDSLPTVGLLRAPGSWGWGTWKRAWRHYRDDPAAQVEEIKRRDPSRFNFENTYQFLEALERNASGDLETWAVRWYASVYLRGGLNVYPGKSLVRNIGFGDDGTNCKPGPMAQIFARQPLARPRVKIDPATVGNAESSVFAEATRAFYKWQQYQWAKPSLTERVRGSFTDRVLGSLQKLSSRTR